MPSDHGDLADLLRTWRDRLSPADVGLPGGRSRRAAGLRREELAALADLSVDYIVRLEQGRARRPSAQVVASLARALQLADRERDLLYRVSGLQAPGMGMMSTHVPAGVQRLIARLSCNPIGVFTASWTLLSWSPMWAALLGDPSGRAESDRNLLRTRFLELPDDRMLTRLTIESSNRPEMFDRSLVGDLRLVRSRYPDDPDVARLVRDLLDGSELFARLWNEGAVGEHASERKIVHNPAVGAIELDCDVLTVPGADIRIVAYTAAEGTADAEKLDFLRVAGVGAAAIPVPGPR